MATLACWLGGARRVYVTEHLAPYGPISARRRWERRAFGMFVTRLVAVSEKNREQRAARLHTPVNRTKVVTNGIDVNRFEHIAPSEAAGVRAQHGLDGAVVVGTAVRLEADKGIDDLVDAFAIVARDHPDARLLLVGDGSQRGQLEAQVERLGLGDVTTFTGFQPDPRPYLAAMDVFVLPVPAGSASIGLLEAMATGLPAIITFGSPGEAVEPGVSGWWANPHDPTDLADKISDLVDRPAERAAMGKAAHDRIVEDFSAARVARELGHLYQTNE
jgi:glycosyltransferase involved in cell wall biosynthesis